jgi:uncharacterized phage protein (TIGR01671 family)
MYGSMEWKRRNEIMRPIKFRGRRIDTGKWVYGDYFRTPLTDENSGAPSEAGWFFLTGEPRHCIGQNGVAFVIDEKTLGQITQIVDTKGIEIYEGDLVRNIHMTMKRYDQIVYSADGYCAFMKKWPTGQLDWIDGSILEVVGNVHENPEMAK